MACSRMTKPTKGIHGRLLKKLYEGVVIPKMLYAADVWCAGLLKKGKGKKNGGRGARGFAAKMTRVQQMATSMIMGGMCSTATDVMDTHANILPFQQLLRKYATAPHFAWQHSRQTTRYSRESNQHMKTAPFTTLMP